MLMCPRISLLLLFTLTNQKSSFRITALNTISMLTTPELFIPDSTSSLTLKCLISTPNEIFNRHPKPNRAKNKFLISLDSVRAFYFISLAVNQTELLKRQIPKSSLLFLTSHKCCFKKSCSLRLIGSDYNLFPLLRPPILTHHQLVPGLLQQSHN